MLKWYEALYYNGDGLFPAYYVIDTIEGETMEKALKSRIAVLIQRVREMFDVGDEIADRKLYDSLYIMHVDRLVCIKSVS